jgi:putative transposase
MEHIVCDQDFLDISKAQYTRQINILSLAEHEQSSSNRNEAIKLAFKSGAYTLKEIGNYFGLHYSRISRIVSGKRAKGKA